MAGANASIANAVRKYMWKLIRISFCHCSGDGYIGYVHRTKPPTSCEVYAITLLHGARDSLSTRVVHEWCEPGDVSAAAFTQVRYAVGGVVVGVSLWRPGRRQWRAGCSPHVGAVPDCS